MAAILRIKRKKDDEPSDALLIACKRQKTDKDSSTPITSIVKFAGTVNNEEDNFINAITKTLNRDELRANYKQHTVEITKKIRDSTRKESSEGRYKILNNFRSLDTSQIEDLEDDFINIIDVEDSKSCIESESSPAKTEADYVYDLYFARTKEHLTIEDLISIEPVEDEFVFEDYTENDPEFQYTCESEDSNSESNFRNDYPDESDHSQNSLSDSEIRMAVMNLNLDDDNQLSSDEDLVYALDEKDVDKYGFKYANYKARMKKEKMKNEESNSNNSSDSENDYYYECASEREDTDNE